MGGKSAPKAPDYRGAAEQTAEASKAATEYQTHANRGDTYTPWGSSTWQSEQVRDPVTGNMVPKWTNTIGLSQGQQGALDDQMAIQGGRSAIAKGMLGNANQEMATPENFWNTLPDAAQTPNVPNYYGQNLPTMGQFPDARSDTPFPTGGQQQPWSGEWGQSGGGIMAPQGQRPQDFQGGQGGMFGGKPPTQQQRGQGQSPSGEQTLAGYDSLRPTAQGPRTENQANLPDRGLAPSEQNYGAENIQRGLDFEGTQGLDAGGGYQQNFADQQFDRQMSILGPRQEKAQAQLETRLRNQGLRPGTESYDAQMNDLRTQQGEETNRLSADAVRFGADQQQAQFGREMQQRQQEVGEIGQQGDFANQASQQALNQQLGIGGQQFGEQLQGGQFQNQQRQQGLQEQQQRFNQGLAGGQFQNQTRGQQFGELKDIAGMQGGAASAQFQRELQAAQFANQQRQQAANEQLQFGNQGFNQQMQQSQFQNQQRQQALAEQMQKEGWSLNKINAMLSGQQVGMPQMPSFIPAGASQGADYLGAAQSQGQFDTQNNQAGNIWGAVGSIGGGLLGGPMGGALGNKMFGGS